MSGSSGQDGDARAGVVQDRAPGTFDWNAIERSDEFRELVRRRRAFIMPAAAVSGGVFIAYLLLAAFAEDLMASQPIDGLPLAWLLAACMVFMTWAVTWLYLRKSDREWQPLERRAAERAEAAVAAAERAPREEAKVR